MRRGSKSQSDTVEEANVLPVMNIMFLLIPALLLAMEVATMAAIVVTPPKFTPTGKESSPPPTEKPLNFKVYIKGDAIFTEVDQHVAQPGEPGHLPRREGALDLAGLTAFASQLKHEHRDSSIVEVTAESDVRYDEIVATMDALRGDECSLRDPERAGCLFWQPIVFSM